MKHNLPPGMDLDREGGGRKDEYFCQCNLFTITSWILLANIYFKVDIMMIVVHHKWPSRSRYGGGREREIETMYYIVKGISL